MVYALSLDYLKCVHHDIDLIDVLIEHLISSCPERSPLQTYTVSLCHAFALRSYDH